MLVPTVGSVIKIRTRYSQGPLMVPPAPDHNVYEGKVLAPYKWLNDRQFCMTGSAEWPVRVISIDLVEDLELLSGNVKNIDTSIKTFEVSGSKNNKYLVTSNSKGWSCTCPGFQFRKQCKHVSTLSGVK